MVNAHYVNKALKISGMVYLFTRAKQIWKELRLYEIIVEALMVDRLGAKMLEFMLCESKFQCQYKGPIVITKIVAATCWYFGGRER